MLASLTTKLAHPLAEVRQRAVHLLASKASANLLQLDELRTEPNLPRNLLALANDAMPSTQLECLSLLERMADGAEDTSRTLVQLGAISELNKIQSAAAASADGADDAVAAAAARTAEKILRHPGSSLPSIGLPGHPRVGDEPAITDRAERTPPPAAMLSASHAVGVRGGAPAAAPAPHVSRTLNFAGLASASDAPLYGAHPAAAAACAAAVSSAAAVSYGETDEPSSASPFASRRPAGARLMLACPGWMELTAPSLSRADEQALFEAAVRLQVRSPSMLAALRCPSLPFAALR